MDLSNAVTKLVAKLYEVGYENTEFSCLYSEGEVTITIHCIPEGNAKLTITIGEFWAYPGKACYFVNYSNQDNGNFTACEGTPSADKAIYDLGAAMQFAQSSSHTKPRRVLELPEGFRNIYVETGRENMVGDMLVMETNGGVTVKVDCLALQGDNEGSVGVYQEGKGESLNDVAYITFGMNAETEVGLM